MNPVGPVFTAENQKFVIVGALEYGGQGEEGQQGEQGGQGRGGNQREQGG